jgi:hypothetical protein
MEMTDASVAENKPLQIKSHSLVPFFFGLVTKKFQCWRTVECPAKLLHRNRKGAAEEDG